MPWAWGTPRRLPIFPLFMFNLYIIKFLMYADDIALYRLVLLPYINLLYADDTVLFYINLLYADDTVLCVRGMFCLIHKLWLDFRLIKSIICR